MKFRTIYSSHKEFVSNCGSPDVVDYEYQMVRGIQELVPVGKHSLYEQIQAEKDLGDIDIIVQRFIHGDVESINRADAFYADVRDFPTTYAELFDRVQQSENVFNALDPKVKKAFDNDFRKFWSEYGTEDFKNIIDNIFGTSSDNGDSIKDSSTGESEGK